jgi:hypothetical protein
MPDTKNFTPAELRSATYAALSAEPTSDLAVSLCQSLAAKLFHQRVRGATRLQTKATGAIVADLLERDPDDMGGWLYHSTSPNAFNASPIGYRPFVAAYDAMSAFMVQTVRGTRQYTSSALTGGTRQVNWDRATRFRADPWLRDWFADEGIGYENWGDHFTRIPQPIDRQQASIALRPIRTRRFNGYTFATSLTIDRADPQVGLLIRQMDRLNEFLEQQDLQPFGPVFLRRIFATEPETQPKWNLGGRLYAVGGENYQNVRKDARSSIKINGEAVTELDVRASHLTLLVGLGYLPKNVLEGDPYEIDGIPRSVVKQWVTMTISHGSRHRAWPKKAREEFLEKHGIDLSKQFPLRTTGDTILLKLPIVGGDNRATLASWGELQFLESQIILKTLEVLAFDLGVPALPVHDSIIVPQSKADLAASTLKECFKSIGGVEPEVEI